jgi:hypothetical protein
MSETDSGSGTNVAMLVVPETPGPLIDPGGSSQSRPRDEIDEAIDELFGPDPGGSPGPLDAILLAGGLCLALWAWLTSHSIGLVIVGVVIAFLGVILPLRSAKRRLGRWRTTRRQSAAFSRGLALDAGDPVVRRLVEAYSSLLAATERPDVTVRAEAVTAAHLALIESASLLGGGAPTTPTETAYLERRIAAILELTGALERVDAGSAEIDEGETEMSLERAARTLAGEELDAGDLSSLRELRDLARGMRAD